MKFRVGSFFWMPDRKEKAAKAAFDASVDCGITFFDTAEIYGSRVIYGWIFLVISIKLPRENIWI